MATQPPAQSPAIRSTSIDNHAPELTAEYDLDPRAAGSLAADGFVRLNGVLSTELVGAAEPEITQKVLDLNTMHLPMEDRDSYSKAFLQVTNLWQHSNTVRTLVFSRRLAKIAADLLGVASVRLYHDQALYKEPGGGITPWHADQYYWPLNTDRTITVWIPLQDTPAQLGPLEFATGSHHFEFGRDLPISDESEQELQAALQRQGFPTDRTPYKVGDVSYHLGWTFHRAEPNTSTTPRRVMTVIYIDAQAAVAEPTNEHQRLDREAFMHGMPTGQPPTTRLTPILYSK